ncbi:MAG TPA: alpha/beta fold hydrolase [Actinomycetota bacterium]|nr:alpha/beta fold hydrolase [Actinomycetota bacterium]
MDVRTGHVSIEGGDLYCEQAGEGFPVVLIHPGLWDCRIWDAQFESFAAHHHVVRYDLRGYGRSDPPTGPYSDVGDLRSLLSELSIERCALVGCSSGGQLAIDATLSDPSSVDALVLVSTNVTGYVWEDPDLDDRFDAVELAVAADDLEGAVDAQMALWAPLDPDGETTARIRSIASDNTRVLRIPDAMIRAREPAIGRLPELEAATLVIVGERDVREIHAIADLVAERVPGVLKREIHEADHLVMVRQPAVFNRVVLDFLSFRM